nr:acetyl-CoA carboxylase carboxyltransferase beta subunit [Littorella uniflora]
MDKRCMNSGDNLGPNTEDLNKKSRAKKKGKTIPLVSLNETNESEGSILGTPVENSDLTKSNDLLYTEPINPIYYLWVLCENCNSLHFIENLKSKLYVCEFCEEHLKMSNSSERIELSIDPGTWDPMDEDLVSLDPDLIEVDSEEEELDDEDEEDLMSETDDSDSEEELPMPEEEPDIQKVPVELPDKRCEEENRTKIIKKKLKKLKRALDKAFGDERSRILEKIEKLQRKLTKIDLDSAEEDEVPYEEVPYEEYLDSYQTRTGLTEAVQTGVGQLNGIPVAIGVMDFQFIGGSMGSVVGEKITRLIEYATDKLLPLIIVCASGGARMQEGSLSLMQMAKISLALEDYQSKEKLFYVAILTSPTTGGVTASFGMLGDIIIAEPNAYIAFAGKRVIEETVKKIVPEGSQETENLFKKGLFDLILPRNLLKIILSELLEFHHFLPLK